MRLMGHEHDLGLLSEFSLLSSLVPGPVKWWPGIWRSPRNFVHGSLMRAVRAFNKLVKSPPFCVLINFVLFYLHFQIFLSAFVSHGPWLRVEYLCASSSSYTEHNNRSRVASLSVDVWQPNDCVSLFLSYINVLIFAQKMFVWNRHRLSSRSVCRSTRR